MESEPDRPKVDSRKSLRVPLIILKVHITSDRPTFFGYSKNISSGGMFIATTNPIQAGEQIDLEFQLPAPLKGISRCRCEVVWKRPHNKHLPFEPGLGMKFVDIPAEITDQLDRWVKGQQ